MRFGNLLLERLRPRSRVLEIGSGEGALASMLAAAGHDVTAIERRPRGEFAAIEASFEDFDFGNERFDCIVAMLVLHHAADLRATLHKVDSLLRPGGFVAIDDYGWERHPSPAEEWRRDREDLLTSIEVLSTLDAVFERSLYREHAYLDDGEGSDRMAFSYIGVSCTPAQG